MNINLKSICNTQYIRTDCIYLLTSNCQLGTLIVYIWL